MAGPIARLYATLGLDTRGFDKGIAATQTKTQKFAAGFKQQALAGFGLGAGFAGGAVAFNALATGAQAAIGYMGDAISLASDWEEANNKVGVVFTTMADDIRAFSKTASTSMGMSEREALQALGTFGNFAQALGIAEQAAADMSKEMVQLAGDIGSFNNIATDEVLVALRSGLAGQTEPMQRFGVDVSAARVEAELLASGVKKVNGAFTQAQKVQGRYNLIMRQTKTAQGDFIRTGDGFANVMKTIDSQLEEAQTEIGTALMPLMLTLVTFIRDTVVPAIKSLADELGKIGDTIGDIVDTYNDAVGKLNEVAGRDLGNDFANAVRIAGTGGFALVIDSVDDVQRGLQRASEGADIFAEKSTTAFDVARGAALRTSFAVAGLADTVVEPPSIADPMADEFADTVKAITQGFGDIKQALANPPKFISDADRIVNMEKRAELLRQNIRRARAAGDTRSQRFWERGLTAQETRLMRFRGAHGKAGSGIVSAHAKAGRKVKEDWTKAGDAVTREARATANGTVRQVQRIEEGIRAIDLTGAGLNMMLTLAQGIRLGMPYVTAALPSAAGGGGGGTNVMVNGNVYGGAAGLRQLQGEIDQAVRPTRRERR